MGKRRKHTEIKKDQRRLYGDLAWTWPIISPPEEYVEESERIKEVIFKYSKIPAKTLLNLGCGGGHVDWILKKYFRITGVDMSTQMLGLAKKLNPQVTYLKGDMRKVRLPRMFDAVLIHDSINYMLTKRDLRAAFKTGFVHLRPGGVLYTAIEVHGKLQQNKISFSIHKRKNVEITFIEHSYDPNPRDTTYQSTFIYLIRRNKKLRIATDRHMGGIFPLDTWLEVVKKVGFKVKKLHYKHSQVADDMPELVCLKPA